MKHGMPLCELGRCPNPFLDTVGRLVCNHEALGPRGQHEPRVHDRQTTQRSEPKDPLTHGVKLLQHEHIGKHPVLHDAGAKLQHARSTRGPLFTLQEDIAASDQWERRAWERLGEVLTDSLCLSVPPGDCFPRLNPLLAGFELGDVGDVA